MTSIFERLAHDLFSHEIDQVRVSFVEISGDKCHDLLNDYNLVSLLKCKRGVKSRRNSVTGDTEYFEAFPMVEPSVGSGSDFLALISCGIDARSTAATGICNLLLITVCVS